MKISDWLHRILLLITIVVLSCDTKNEEVFNGIFSKNGSLATISTTPATSVTEISAEAGGNITDNGSTYIMARGICWDTDQNPDTSDFKIENGKETGEFKCNITGLSPGTVYYLRAYVSNAIGTAYGNQETFTTLTVPTILTTPVSAITDTSAVSGGNVTADGGVIVTSKGVCWSTKQNPTIADSISKDGSGLGYFTSTLKKLSPNTRYFVRAYATNSLTTFYGIEYGFTTTSPTLLLPTLTTTAITAITQTTAMSGGNITSDGGAKVTARGVCWGTSSNPVVTGYHLNGDTISGNPSSFSNLITGLTANTTYYVRAYATNSVGTAYGNELAFTTSASSIVTPSITTAAISSITQTSAISGGNVSSDGGATVTARGVCWGTTTSPTIVNSKTSDGTGNGTFSSLLTGLTAGTLYYVRAYATNSVGTAYGNEISFTTLPPSGGTVTDIDGNVYNTIVIGTQTWMKENLKTTKYNDGSSIPIITDNSIWGTLTTGAYCWYDNAPTFATSPYGALYNWYSIDPAGNGGKNVCPAGWHVPSDIEWTYLTNSLSGESVAGGKLKESGTTHWSIPPTGATNESGFTALPGGYRHSNGSFFFNGLYGDFWSTSGYNSGSAWYRFMYYGNNSVGRDNVSNQYGFSIRCLLGESVVTLSVTTLTTTNITQSTASSGGNVTSDGGNTVTARGVCWSTSANPTIADNKTSEGTGVGVFTSLLSGLTQNTMYYVRAYATNNNGTVYGFEQTFTTSPGIPVVPTLTTNPITAITTTSAISGGNITSNGGYGITESGVCWSTSSSPTVALTTKTNDATSGLFSSSINGLLPGTLYYVRAYATNVAGTAYGNEISFSTLPLVGSTVNDIDGNVYNTVTIGTQTWLKENLKTTKFRDGTAIAFGSDPATWNAYSNLNTAAYCWYNDDLNYKNSYGALYNFYSVIDGHKICPTGWHVPSNAEWTILENYAGGSSIGGGKLKESGLTHWLAPNTGATDEYGYSALPGGYRSSTGAFTGIGNGGYYWSSTENPVSICYGRYLSYMSVLIETAPAAGPRGTGFSVRCLQGEPAPLAIGDCYQGGIIAYIFQSGDPGYKSGETHGLIAAPSDQSTSAEWGCVGINISGADSTGLGRGNQNTIDILNGCATAGTAAKICSDLVLNGYNDWYLPSRDELNKLYLNKEKIGAFTLNFYWSSSEFGIGHSWYQHFLNGTQGNVNKDNLANVRAIRSF